MKITNFSKNYTYMKILKIIINWKKIKKNCVFLNKINFERVNSLEYTSIGWIKKEKRRRVESICRVCKLDRIILKGNLKPLKIK